MVKIIDSENALGYSLLTSIELAAASCWIDLEPSARAIADFFTSFAISCLTYSSIRLPAPARWQQKRQLPKAEPAAQLLTPALANLSAVSSFSIPPIVRSPIFMAYTCRSYCLSSKWWQDPASQLGRALLKKGAQVACWIQHPLVITPEAVRAKTCSTGASSKQAINPLHMDSSPWSRQHLPAPTY